MTLERRVEQLESRLNNLQNAFLQSQKNQVPVTAKTDDTANKVVDITPWTMTKTAYIDDTECKIEPGCYFKSVGTKSYNIGIRNKYHHYIVSECIEKAKHHKREEGNQKDGS